MSCTFKVAIAQLDVTPAPHPSGWRAPDRPALPRGFTPQKRHIAIGLGVLIGLLLAAFWPRRKS